MFRLDSPFMQTLDKIVDLVLLSILWFFLCLTVIGIGPATVALYYAVVKSIRRDRGAPYREFFHAIKENWKVSMILGVIFTAFGVALFIFDLPNIAALFIPESTIPLGWSILSIIKTVIVSALAVYLFPLISRYHVTLSGALMTSLTLSIHFFFYTFIMLVILATAAVAIAAAPYLLLIIPGMLCYLLSYFLEPVFKSIMHEEDRQNLSADDQWYLE